MTLIMFLNQHLKAKNYGMAGAISVYIAIISGVLCFIVYHLMEKEPGGAGRPRKKRLP